MNGGICSTWRAATRPPSIKIPSSIPTPPDHSASVPQSYLRCCLLGSTPHFALNKTTHNSHVGHCVSIDSPRRRRGGPQGIRDLEKFRRVWVKWTWLRGARGGPGDTQVSQRRGRGQVGPAVVAPARLGASWVSYAVIKQLTAGSLHVIYSQLTEMVFAGGMFLPPANVARDSSPNAPVGIQCIWGTKHPAENMLRCEPLRGVHRPNLQSLAVSLTSAARSDPKQKANQ